MKAIITFLLDFGITIGKARAASALVRQGRIKEAQSLMNQV